MLDYDLIIIGGGPAGLTAGIYSARSLFKTLILEGQLPGGQMVNTDRLENYPGYTGEGTAELINTMKEQAREQGAEIRIETAERIRPDSGNKTVNTNSATYTTRAVILAMGSNPRRLGVPGEKELTGRGVSYCAICDGALYRNKEVMVVGGGDSAVKEAIFLTRFASRVTLVHRRDELRAVRALQEEAFANEKIEFLFDSVVTAIHGEQAVTAASVKNKETGREETVPIDGIFIYVGFQPNTGLVENLVECNPHGFIVTDENLETSEPGIFAAGDIRHKPLRQVITAAADGAIAAHAAERYMHGSRTTISDGVS